MGNQPKSEALTEGISSSLSIDTLDDIARAADMIFRSGAFSGLSNPQEAGAKIMAGLELGLSPMTAVRNIYFFDGSVTLSGPVLAALIRQHPEYDYKILGANTKGAKVRFFRREVVDGERKMVAQTPDVQFTKRMAEKAGLLSKQNWQDYPEDMYVWRCVARGSRWHCPEVGKGSLYIKDEVAHGTVEAEPVEKAESEPGPDAENEAEQIPASTESTTETPDFTEKDFTEKKETSETSEEAPVKPEEPEEANGQTEDQKKPLDPDTGSDESTKESGKEQAHRSSGTAKASDSGGGSNGAPAKPTAEATAPANTPGQPGGNGEEEDEARSGQSGQMEDATKRISAMLPSYTTVNAGAVTKEAAQKANAMQTELRAMDPGNQLLTQIKEYRDEVREMRPNEEDADRKALEEVLDHHISRIGGSDSGPGNKTENGSSPESPDEPDTSGTPDTSDTSDTSTETEGAEPSTSGREKSTDAPDPIAEEIEVAGMPWFDSIGRKFRVDMEKTRDILKSEAEKKGITPLNSRLDEVETRFEDANPTPEHENAFEKCVAPYRTVLSMREALMGGNNPEIEVFNRVVGEFMDRVEEYPNATRRAIAEDIVIEEAKRLANEFEDVTLNVGGDELSAEGPEEAEESGSNSVPNIPLPPGFPKKEALTDAGIDRTGEVAKRLRTDTLTNVKGIGNAFAEQIADYLRSIADGGEQEEIGF